MSPTLRVINKCWPPLSWPSPLLDVNSSWYMYDSLITGFLMIVCAFGALKVIKLISSFKCLRDNPVINAKDFYIKWTQTIPASEKWRNFISFSIK